MRMTLMVPALLLLSVAAKGQELKIGDVLPDLSFSNVINHPGENLRLSTLGKKLVIFDFWATSCNSCMKSFPRIDSLQKKFNSAMQIILVTRQSRDSIERFFSKRKKLKMPGVPMICGDTVLSRLFPKDGYPYYVWVDSARRVAYTTDNHHTTASKIEQYLNGRDPEIELAIKLTRLETLIDRQWEDIMGYYSYIAKAHPVLALEGGNIPGYVRLTWSRTSAEALYQKAFYEIMNRQYKFWRPGHTILEVAAPYRYREPDDNRFYTWVKEYSYSYQLLLPETQKARQYHIMKQDLDRYFGLEATIEDRKLKFLTLVRTSRKDKLKTAGKAQKDNLFITDYRFPVEDSMRSMMNRPFEIFAGRLRGLIEGYLSVPFMDATGYKGNIDVTVASEVLDSLHLEGLRKWLRTYDLDLVEKHYTSKVLVLKEPLKER